MPIILGVIAFIVGWLFAIKTTWYVVILVFVLLLIFSEKLFPFDIIGAFMAWSTWVGYLIGAIVAWIYYAMAFSGTEHSFSFMQMLKWFGSP